jgi:ABC-type phosphate/phosphonate transport system substrate-binding protein
VRKDRGIRLVEDLRSKTAAFVDPAWSSGCMYPMVLLDPPE